MSYSNEKIERLIAERNKKMSELDYEIQKEIEKEGAKHKFSWKRFGLLLFIMIVPFLAYELNHKLFSSDSIWSWEYFYNHLK